MNFQSLGNFDKNAKRKLNILCPFNKIMMSQVGLLHTGILIQYLNQMLLDVTGQQNMVHL